MAIMNKVIREPLVHFVLLSMGLFIVHAALNDAPTAKQNSLEITVSKAQIDQSRARFRQTWQRDPTPAEMEGLINTLLREEILVREALLLSMDENDALIRQRLAQKMNVLIEAAASAKRPSETELQDYFEKNKHRYTAPGMVTFEQLFLGANPTENEISESLSALNEDNSAGNIGIGTALPAHLRQVSELQVDQTFGARFYAQIEHLGMNTWHAPIRSAFGLHAVRVTERQEPSVPLIETVRARVEADLSAQRSQEQAAQIYADMRARYTISIPLEMP